MMVNRRKGAWTWVAMAAISLASLACVQSGVQNARHYADPVIKFFAAAQQADADASARAHRATSRAQTGATGINLLAVFFVGLVAPLVLESFRARFVLQHPPCAPVPAELFQRPPPAFLA